MSGRSVQDGRSREMLSIPPSEIEQSVTDYTGQIKTVTKGLTSVIEDCDKWVNKCNEDCDK